MKCSIERWHERGRFSNILGRQIFKHTFHNLITFMTDREQHRERRVKALTHSVVPIAPINGSVDPVSGARMVARYREVVSSDHFVVELPGIRHYPQVEAPRAVVDAYLRFLRQL